MQLLKKNKKGFAAVQGVILTVVIIAVTLAVGLMILGQLKASLTPGSEEANATSELLMKLGTLPTYIGILIIVTIFGVILAYLMGWLGGRRRGAA
jgi:amino acid permease